MSLAAFDPHAPEPGAIREWFAARLHALARRWALEISLFAGLALMLSSAYVIFALTPEAPERPQPAPTPDDALAFPLGGAAPHAVVLAVADRVLQACVADRADATDRLSLLGVLVGERIEDRRIEPPTCGLVQPTAVHVGRFCPPRVAGVQRRPTVDSAGAVDPGSPKAGRG